MSLIIKKRVTEGLEVQIHDDGHWLFFESKGKRAAVCVEAKFGKTKIIKEAITGWVEDRLAED